MKKSLVVIALVVAALCSLFVFSVSATEQENIHISSTEFETSDEWVIHALNSKITYK